MRKETIGVLVLFGSAVLSAVTAYGAPNYVPNPGTPVKFDTTVTSVYEVPAGKPLSGLHLQAKVNGRDTDIYLSPMNFAVRYGVQVAKGEYVRIMGYSQTNGDILAREITTGNYDAAHNIFRPTLTIYLRNDEGPFWIDTQRPID